MIYQIIASLKLDFFLSDILRFFHDVDISSDCLSQRDCRKQLITYATAVINKVMKNMMKCLNSSEKNN